MSIILFDKTKGVKIEDNNEPLVDLRVYPGFILSTKRSAINPSFCFVRKTVAEKLMKAQTLLPKGIQIIFEEGHRPIAVQKKIFNDYYQQVKLKNPNFTDEQLKQECYKYVADPEGTPPHSTGGAIDISLADENGNEIDMGSSSDDTPDNNGDRNYTFSENITAEGKRNRKILIDIMEELDFVNYPTEWWHWSYGDQYWAFVKKTNAIYGTIENPEYPPDLSASYFS